MSLILSDEPRNDEREPSRDTLAALVAAVAYVGMIALSVLLSGCGGGDCDAQCQQEQAQAEQRATVPASPSRERSL